MDAKSIKEAESTLATAKASGDVSLEAAATLFLAKARTSSLAKKLDTSEPFSEDSMEALRRAQDAFALFSSMGSREGAEEAAHVASLVMMYNGAPPEAYERPGSCPNRVGAGDVDDNINEVEWAALDAKVPSSAKGLGQVMFVGADAGLRKALTRKFPKAAFSGNPNFDREDCAVVVYVGALGAEEEIQVLHGAMTLAQQAVVKKKPATMWWVTRGLQTAPLSGYVHAGIWGMARSFRTEEKAVDLRCLDLDGVAHGGDDAAAEALQCWLGRLSSGPAVARENEVAVRLVGGAEQALVARLTQSRAAPVKPSMLAMVTRGSLSNLTPMVQQNRPKPLAHEAELRVRAVGLSVRDVLNVMGECPGSPGLPGGDCAGTVLSVGADVTHVAPADDVFGVSPGCLRTYSCGKAALLTQKPASWAFEEAGCVPAAFVAVEEALGDLAGLGRGEHVLIHAAAGAVGLLAIQHAQRVGAEIIATVGTQEKHEHLRSLGVKHILSSRDGASFEKDARALLREKKLDGIDVVINSLSADDYITRSLALLRQGGRFMEIGKTGTWSHAKMFKERPDVSYEKVDTDAMMELSEWEYNARLKRLPVRAEEGSARPINMHLFQGMESGVQAFQFLQSSQHIGKVVLSVPSSMSLRPDTEYILSGGMGALGMVTAQYMIEEGAKFLSLLSRGGKPSSDIVDIWERLQSTSATVKARACDVSSLGAVQELAVAMRADAGGRSTGPATCGVLHLAGVLKDAMLSNQTREHLEASYSAKVWGARHLHAELSAEPGSLEFMLLFSGTAALFGSPGQANYSAANASLDGHARYWTQQGEKARSVVWGPWTEVGMALHTGAASRFQKMGVYGVTNTHGMATLAAALEATNATLVMQPMQWSSFLKIQGGKVLMSRFEADVKAQKKSLLRPDLLLQEVVAGKHTTKKNSLPDPPKPARTYKLEEVIPSVKQLDRAKFGWYTGLTGYSYTLTWQPTKALKKDRSMNNRSKRGEYDVLGLNTGSKSFAVPALIGARSNDASQRGQAFMIYMVSPDVYLKQGTAIMGLTNTIGSMILSRMPKLAVVTFGESQADPDANKVRHMHHHTVALAQLRSLRLECPGVTVGYVGGDFASWMADPAPMVENIFDVVESDESERMYKNGDSYVPLLVEKSLDDAVECVKTGPQQARNKAWMPVNWCMKF